MKLKPRTFKWPADMRRRAPRRDPLYRQFLAPQREHVKQPMPPRKAA